MKSTWFDYYASPSEWTAENLFSSEIVNLLNENDHGILASNLIQNNNLVVLTLDPLDNDLVLFHHINQVGGNIRVKGPKLMALNGFGPLASVVRFKPSKETFSYLIAPQLTSSHSTHLPTSLTSSQRKRIQKHFEKIFSFPMHSISFPLN